MAFYPPKWKIWRRKNLEVSPSRSLWETACVDGLKLVNILSVGLKFQEIASGVNGSYTRHFSWFSLSDAWLQSLFSDWSCSPSKCWVKCCLVPGPHWGMLCAWGGGPPRQDQSHRVYSQLLLSNTYVCFKWAVTSWTLFLWASVSSSQKWE